MFEKRSNRLNIKVYTSRITNIDAVTQYGINVSSMVTIKIV